MSEEFYFKTLGMEFGPVTLEEIEKMIDSGSLKQGDMIRSSTDSWINVSKFTVQSFSGSSPSSTSKNSNSVSQSHPLHPPQPRSKPAVVPKSNKEQWLYLVGTKTCGPCTTELFMGLVSEGVVTPQTMVKLVGETEWTKAGNIPGLVFPETPCKTPASGNSLSPLKAAKEDQRRELPLNRHRATVEQTPHRQADSRIVDLRSRGIENRFSSKEGRLSRREIVRDAENPDRSHFTLVSGFKVFLSSKILWGSTCVALLVWLAIFLPSTFLTQKKAFEQLDRIRHEFSDLKSNKADSGQWSEFLQKTNRELADLIPFLEKNARGKDPISISLLRVARDDFPRLFQQRLEREPGMVHEIEAHLWLARTKFEPVQSVSSKLDLLTTVVVVLDVVGACAAAVFFGARWWYRQFVTK